MALWYAELGLHQQSLYPDGHPCILYQVYAARGATDGVDGRYKDIDYAFVGLSFVQRQPTLALAPQLFILTCMAIGEFLVTLTHLFELECWQQ